MEMQGRGRPRKGSTKTTLAQFGYTRQQAQDAKELAAVPSKDFEAAIAQALAEAKAHGRHLTESRVYRILGIGRERRRENVGSADILPSEDLLAWAAELSPEERRMYELALRITKVPTR
jgi:hypothetical protein